MQAEDGPPGCTADSEIDAESWLSADLGTELGESRSAATAVASSPDGTGTDADDESAASGGAQRRPTRQEEVVAGSRTGTTGGVSVSIVGEPARSNFAAEGASGRACACLAIASNQNFL